MRTFGDYDTVRRQLGKVADEVGDIAVAFRTARTEYEDEVSGSEEDQQSAVELALEEAKERLDRSRAEIGIFGEIKRGKSTLLNAILAAKVSSVDINPETAVPVWVEPGTGSARIIFSDGTEERVADREAAMDMATQRQRKRSRRKGDGREVLRVIQYVDLPWLTSGVRLVDTPGLSDPSLTEVYEELTFAELDRVAAAVIVFMSPPGIAASEMRLLQQLGQRGVDKVFLVCNFFPDHWRDEGARQQVVDHIRECVIQGAAQGKKLLYDDVRVYDVNAQAAWDAREDEESEAYEASGVADLQRDLEAYVAEGVLSRLVQVVGDRLGIAGEALGSAIDRRVVLLSDTSLLEGLRMDRKSRVDESNRRLDRLIRQVDGRCAELKIKLRDVVSEPFSDAVSEVRSAEKRNDLDSLQPRTQMKVELMGIRADQLTEAGVAELETYIAQEVADSFGFTEDLLLEFQGSSLRRPAAQLFTDSVGKMTSSDMATIAGVGGLAGIGLGAVGGSIAGGVGMALIALGPVGWLIGAGIGAAAGLVLGGAGTAAYLTGRLSPGDKNKLTSEIESQKRGAQDEADLLVDRLNRGITKQLRDLRDRFSKEDLAELEAIDTFIKDSRGREHRLAESRQQKERLARALDSIGQGPGVV